MTMGDKNAMNNMPQNPWQFPLHMGGMYSQMPMMNYQSAFGNRGQFFPPQFFNQNVGPHNLPMMGNPNFHPNGPAMAPMPFQQFTPGGKLGSFSSIQQSTDGSNPKKEESKKDEDSGKSRDLSNANSKKNEKNNLPPLPPSPPPDFNKAPKPPLPVNAPPNNTPYKPRMGPVSFNFEKRPNFSNLPNAFTNNNLNQNAGKNSGSAKKRRKREKINQMKRNAATNPNGLNENTAVLPPLPPGSPPNDFAAPLPLSPPPPLPTGVQNENEKPNIKFNAPPSFNPSSNFTQNVNFNGVLPEWPPSFTNWLKRNYERCRTDEDKEKLQKILHAKTLMATNDGSLYFKDWDNEPLPLLEDEINSLNLRPSFKPSDNSNSSKKNENRKNGLNSSLASRLGPKKFNSDSKKNARKYSPLRSKSPLKKRRYRSSSSSDSETSSDEDYRSSKGDRGNHRRKEKGGRSKSKSSFYTELGAASVPVNEELLTKRAARFGNVNKSVPSSINSPKGRKQKMDTKIFSCSLNSSLLFEDTTGDFIQLEKHVVGTCQNIEKPYLRLTAQPESSAVRPADILVKSLERVKEKWKTQQDYHYACEQLKSIRQDLTVQGIRDEFTVKVYEMHARIALEKGDHAEFNQCQSQLKLLYSEVPEEYAANKREFMAYRILYYIFTKEFMDLTTQISILSKDDKEDECIAFSLKVQSSWWLGNYHRLFKLYRSAPKMTSYLMDWFLLRERKQAIKAIIKSYRQVLPVSFVYQELAFDAMKDCLEFLRLLNVVFIEDEELKIDCKASSVALSVS